MVNLRQIKKIAETVDLTKLTECGMQKCGNGGTSENGIFGVDGKFGRIDEITGLGIDRVYNYYFLQVSHEFSCPSINILF